MAKRKAAAKKSAGKKASVKKQSGRKRTGGATMKARKSVGRPGRTRTVVSKIKEVISDTTAKVKSLLPGESAPSEPAAPELATPPRS